MKTITALAIMLVSASTFAQELIFRTADNVSYLIQLQENLPTEQKQSCIQDICKLSAESGNGYCRIVYDFGRTTIVVANLRTPGALAVGKMSCVKTTAFEYEVHGKPSVGKSN